MDSASQNPVKKLDPSQIKYLGSDVLTSLDFLKRIEQLAADDLYDLEPGKAKEFYDALEEVFISYESQFKQNPELYKRFGGIILGLLWKSLIRLQPQVRRSMLSNNVIFCLKTGVAIKAYIKKYLDLYEVDFVADEAERNSFVNSLESNQEKLGSQFLSFRTSGQVPPTIQNWLKDYNTNFPINPKKPEAKRGKLEQLNYIKSSSNVKLLTPEDKKILEEILSISDWLKFPVIEYRERKEIIESKPTPPPAAKGDLSFQLPTTKLNVSKPKIQEPPPTPKPAAPKPAPPKPPAKLPSEVQAGKQLTPHQGVTFKDLGPYVLGAEPQKQTPSRKPQAPIKPQVPVKPQEPELQDLSSKVQETQEATTPYSKYAGFSTDLIKDVEEFSEAVKNKAGKAFIPPEPPKPAVLAEAKPEKPKSPPPGAHELEDFLERSRLKADANIPLSPADTQAIIDLVKRKKENR